MAKDCPTKSEPKKKFRLLIAWEECYEDVFYIVNNNDAHVTRCLMDRLHDTSIYFEVNSEDDNPRVRKNNIILL